MPALRNASEALMRFALLISTLVFAFSTFAQPAPATQPSAPAANPQDDFTISKTRVQQTTEAAYFYTEMETNLDKIATIAGPTIGAMHGALEKSGNVEAGPVTFVMFGASEDPKKMFKL